MNAKKRILALLEITGDRLIDEEKIIDICSIQPHSGKRLLNELTEQKKVLQYVFGPHRISYRKRIPDPNYKTSEDFR